jgi:adenine-specific DNA-methyltransferase
MYGLGTSETAILFIQKGLDITRKDGHLAYILPKSYTYASNYERIRNKTAPHLELLVDCGKVWTNVKIEVCIFALSKAINPSVYASYKFHNEALVFLSRINKTLIPKFGFFPNGLSKLEIDLGLKILGSCAVLNDICENIPGVPNQKYISATATDYVMIGGAEISRTEIRKPKGMIDKAYVENFTGAFVVENSVLVQNIISHIANPIDHIKITACLPKSEYVGVYTLANTINQIVVKPNLNISNHTIWVLLNSKLVNWYVYRFIFGKAIRTMHFYNPVTARLPVPKHLAGLCVPVGLSTEAGYDAWVYELYGLSEEEIGLVEAGMG